ncbi:Sensor histidine kinase LiaS [Streptomyces sp. S4.7]|uniref:sensor histidine kinase n=1 Tax=Streptomyces sp. S4.7 TaxID=2705439 RepID=UPI001397B2EC|nr:histidine kinase [Streptomyces sp. S4.7]QHY94843.1 Sensor histidine kinase LiaS [Streptomyces sp. S4.7]
MTARLRRSAVPLLRPLVGGGARLRWTHLILGGALLMPYWLLGTVIVGPLAGSDTVFSGSLALQFGAFAAALPIAAASALFPLARPLSVAAARAMCGLPEGWLADGPARSRAARVRTAGWFTLHVGLGGIISGMSLALPPFAVALLVLPLSPALRENRLGMPRVFRHDLALTLAPLGGILSLVALAACAAVAGALLARLAPVLLGPTPSDRLAAAERRAADLAVRNRLARELHDSVGHALSAVTLQAGAARRILDSDDPGDMEFVREALTAIEETTRRTVGELDSVLGLLRRDDEPGTDEEAAVGAPSGPTLDALEGLLAHCGVRVAPTVDGGMTAVPERVSREAYRIVQEGLSNALRHGGASPVTLRIALSEEMLEITMDNPLPGTRPAAGPVVPSVVRPGGGRGLRGVTERATLLGGHAEAGRHGQSWRLAVTLPLASEGGAR